MNIINNNKEHEKTSRQIIIQERNMFIIVTVCSISHFLKALQMVCWGISRSLTHFCQSTVAVAIFLGMDQLSRDVLLMVYFIYVFTCSNIIPCAHNTGGSLSVRRIVLLFSIHSWMALHHTRLQSAWWFYRQQSDRDFFRQYFVRKKSSIMTF